ncbi:MAG: hypothetical protein Q8P59_00470, partial [Dehalococcoidia bacterium]|nr:hypothetical protein [Dehalococcoidia bacterium]
IVFNRDVWRWPARLRRAGNPATPTLAARIGGAFQPRRKRSRFNVVVPRSLRRRRVWFAQ